MYTINTSGYYDCPTTHTQKQARELLKQMVKESAEACKRRFGESTIVKYSDDNYTIKIGGKYSTAIWASHSISKY